MNTRGERSTPELFGDAMSQLGKLIGKEFALARAEVSEKVSEAGRAVAFIGAGAILMIPALVLLLFAASAALIRSGFTDPVAYLLVGVATVVISAILIIVGVNRLSANALKPSITLDQVERDKAAAREMVR
jgi:uncharacterized membrane protein